MDRKCIARGIAAKGDGLKRIMCNEKYTKWIYNNFVCETIGKHE